MKDHNDWQLLQEYARSRSQEAFAELVRRHLGWVRASAARQVRDPHLADDVAQAVFVALARKAPKLRREAALSTWLFQVTRYASSTALRGESRRRRHERQAAMSMQDHQSSITPQQWEQLAPTLDKLISRLRAGDQRAVLLRFFEQKSYPDMALAMGISEEAARKRTDRAVDRLRRMVGAVGLNLSAGALSAGLLAHGSATASASLASAALELATHGAESSTAVATLTKGALQMMNLARWRFPLAASAAAVLVTAVAVMATDDGSKTTAAHPAASPATQPAAAPDENSPRGVVAAAFRAAAAGQADGLISRFDQVTPQQAQTLRQAAQVMSATRRFSDAVAQQFGADLEKQVSRALGVGVAETDISDATEAIQGDAATVDIGAGPGEIPLVRSEQAWKISAEVLKKLDSNAVAQLAAGIPAIEQVTADVRAGKYKSIDQLQQVMATLMPELP